jgi:hypothetical protein
MIVLSVLGVALVFAGSALIADARAPTTDASPPDQLAVGIQGTGLHGQLEVYAPNGTRIHHRADAGSYHDVTWLDDGRLLAAYVVESSDCGPYEPPCGMTGYRVIDPATDTIVAEWSFRVRTVGNSEVHDVERVGPGRYLLVDMDRERLLIVANGSIAWEWHASSVYEAPPDPTRRDWLHMNDVDRIGEGRYLVSVRNANQLLVVERGAGVVEVINKDAGGDRTCTRDGELADQDGDGDVRCGDPDILNHQHNPQWLGDGRVLVADSENDRVVELERGADGRWQPVWEVRQAGAEHFRWPRDADRLPNGHTLITDSRNNRVLAVNDSGDVVWQQRTAPLPYDAEVRGVNELVGGPHYDRADSPRRERLSVPVLSTALAGLRHIIAVPHWVTSWHLLVALLGAVGVIEGTARVAIRTPSDGGEDG